MILLGSVQRMELMRLLERHLGRERRLQEVARRQSVDEGTYKAAQEQQRRMSRFEVIPVPGLARVRSEIDMHIYKQLLKYRFKNMSFNKRIS